MTRLTREEMRIIEHLGPVVGEAIQMIRRHWLEVESPTATIGNTYYDWLALHDALEAVPDDIMQALGDPKKWEKEVFYIPFDGDGDTYSKAQYSIDASTLCQKMIAEGWDLTPMLSFRTDLDGNEEVKIEALRWKDA